MEANLNKPLENCNRFDIESTAQDRNYYEGTVDINGDERIHSRYYTYRRGERLIAGVATSVMFTLDRPAKDVWPVLKDFNLWNRGHHHYSGVVGDLEGRTFRLSDQPDEPGPHYFEVVKVIPEYLIIINQPVPADGSTAGLPGLGGVSPGFHVFMLNEHEGKTTVTVYMDHATVSETQDEESALKPWREVLEGHWRIKWRQDFIRNLKALVRQRT